MPSLKSSSWSCFFIWTTSEWCSFSFLVVTSLVRKALLWQAFIFCWNLVNKFGASIHPSPLFYFIETFWKELSEIDINLLLTGFFFSLKYSKKWVLHYGVWNDLFKHVYYLRVWKCINYKWKTEEKHQPICRPQWMLKLIQCNLRLLLFLGIGKRFMLLVFIECKMKKKKTRALFPWLDLVVCGLAKGTIQRFLNSCDPDVLEKASSL